MTGSGRPPSPLLTLPCPRAIRQQCFWKSPGHWPHSKSQDLDLPPSLLVRFSLGLLRRPATQGRLCLSPRSVREAQCDQFLPGKAAFSLPNIQVIWVIPWDPGTFSFPTTFISWSYHPRMLPIWISSTGWIALVAAKWWFFSTIINWHFSTKSFPLSLLSFLSCDGGHFFYSTT